MLKISHIAVAGNALDEIQSNIDWKINKIAYLFGSVAPDINFVYPVHTFTKTIKRFKKRISRAEDTSRNIIKSFTLGVITHYICDYFCYAHNKKMGDPKHMIYERLMKKHIKTHMDTLDEYSVELKEQWNEVLKHTLDSMETCSTVENVLNDIHNCGKDHIEYIILAMTEMHDKYMSYSEESDESPWFKSKQKIEIDINYARFMCEKIMMFILCPETELAI